MRIALIGGTGLVGALLARRLLDAGYELHRIQRRGSEEGGELHILAPAHWADATADLKPDVAISALGTTMRAAGSQAGFQAIDLDLVVSFAHAARQGGARRMITVSSTGADPASRNFYLRTKGKMEAELGALGFDRLDILRPGLLRGARGGERRWGERLGVLLSPITGLILRGSLDRFAAIDADVVAAAAFATLSLPEAGTHIHHNREIRRLTAR